MLRRVGSSFCPRVVEFGVGKKTGPPYTTDVKNVYTKKGNMKIKLIAPIISLSMLIAGYAHADTVSCATKAGQIQTQLDIAKKAGNANQVAGLGKALKETQQHCTDARQNQRAEEKVREKQGDVAEARQDISKAEASLRVAQAKGDTKKIQKAQKKLTEKQGKLQEAQEELRGAQADLAALKG
ncbi:Protein of unknown function [Collimonas sp. OK307]|nr:Protein of unknown function [Collimonas sp. OK307]